MKIRKAIIPVAGMGTRFLPATKAQPKEMLPVVDKPVIQYIVEEAVASGIEEIIFVTAMGKRALEDHFDRNFELEYRLEQKGKTQELEAIEQIGKLAKFAFVRQPKPLGDGHAILCARPFLDPSESVVVLFGDDLFAAPTPVTAQLLAAHEEYAAPVAALYEVDAADVGQYGIAAGTMITDDIMELDAFVEKPALRDAPSRLAGVGRYLVTPEIMEMLAEQEPGADGEVRLADTFAQWLGQGERMYGKIIEGTRYDCGNKLQFVIAQIEMGLRHPDIGPELARYLDGR